MMSTIGLNIAGGEFGGTGGIHNQQYHYPTFAELAFYKDKGVDLIRLPFGWERMQDVLGGPLDLTGDVALLKKVLADAAALGMDVIIDCHNYGRYGGKAIGEVGGPTVAQFADFWKKMAIELKDYPALVGYDLMNEPHDMPTSTIWKEAAQAATNAIREVDMANTIIISGDGWSGAHSWQQINANLIINDPANNIVYQAHQYFDNDHSGTYDQSYDGENAYAMMGVDRLKPFVDWLNANGLKGFIGEFGVPSNDPRWLEVQKNALDYMNANGLDGTAWAGGTWWPESYSMFVAKPGATDSAFGDLLEKYYTQFDGFETQETATPTTATTANVTINDVTVNESGGTMTFTVTRSGNLTGVSSVNFSTANGTAVAGVDYASASGTLTFAAGETTKTITVVITDDTLVESPETLTVNLSGGTNVTIVDGSGKGTINSDDVAAQTWSITGTDVGETINGTSGEDAINALGGADTINGSGAADVVDGGAGSDTISYHWSGAALNVDLLRAIQQGGDAQGDRLIAIENIHGSAHGDQLHGNDDANVINGGGGRDVMSGRGGSDKFVFNSAADANGDVITDFSADDMLDFSKFAATFTLSNDGSNTTIKGDLNNDGVADFAVTLSGVHLSVNGVAIAPPPPPPPPPPADEPVVVSPGKSFKYGLYSKHGVKDGSGTSAQSSASSDRLAADSGSNVVGDRLVTEVRDISRLSWGGADDRMAFSPEVKSVETVIGDYSTPFGKFDFRSLDTIVGRSERSEPTWLNAVKIEEASIEARNSNHIFHAESFGDFAGLQQGRFSLDSMDVLF